MAEIRQKTRYNIMSEFEDKIIEEIRKSVLNEIKTNSFLKLQYDRKQILPDGIIERLWESVNWDEVIEEIRPNIQTKICNKIIGSMETELKTDIKNILSIDGVRQKLRVTVYPEIMKVLNDN